MSLILYLSLLLFLPTQATWAGTVCDGYRRDSPQLYKLSCSQNGSGGAKPAGASSSFSDAFKLNPAALPTENSPYGIEFISTFLRSGASPGMPTIALIKGFHRFGTGISTGGGNTFYSNDLIQRKYGSASLTTLNDPETARGLFTNLNLGTSFTLLNLDSLRLQLGLSARYNRITHTVGGGPAIMLAGQILSVGFGLSHEKVSNTFSATDFKSLLFSARLFSFELEYTVLFNSLDPALSNVGIFTITRAFHNIFFTAAIRELNYLKDGDVVQTHFGVQYFMSSRFALGYLYNYIPGGNSFGLQLYL